MYVWHRHDEFLFEQTNTEMAIGVVVITGAEFDSALSLSPLLGSDHRESLECNFADALNSLPWGHGATKPYMILGGKPATRVAQISLVIRCHF